MNSNSNSNSNLNFKTIKMNSDFSYENIETDLNEMQLKMNSNGEILIIKNNKPMTLEQIKDYYNPTYSGMEIEIFSFGIFFEYFFGSLKFLMPLVYTVVFVLIGYFLYKKSKFVYNC
jgi:hypothetical protein